jgi:hypothetical protein
MSKSFLWVDPGVAGKLPSLHREKYGQAPRFLGRDWNLAFALLQAQMSRFELYGGSDHYQLKWPLGTIWLFSAGQLLKIALEGTPRPSPSATLKAVN